MCSFRCIAFLLHIDHGQSCTKINDCLQRIQNLRVGSHIYWILLKQAATKKNHVSVLQCLWWYGNCWCFMKFISMHQYVQLCDFFLFLFLETGLRTLGVCMYHSMCTTSALPITPYLQYVCLCTCLIAAHFIWTKNIVQSGSKWRKQGSYWDERFLLSLSKNWCMGEL